MKPTATRSGRANDLSVPPTDFQRRRFLQVTAMASLGALTTGTPARSGTPGQFAEAVDTSGASAALVAFMTAYFDAKSSRDVDATMAFFSPDLVTYIDATLGWDISGVDAVRGVFAKYMPNWPDQARSYPTRIIGDMKGGAFVTFVNTPELFGGELHILAAVDFKDGKIVRWVDHWDSRDWPNAYGLDKYTLSDYREAQVAQSASRRMQDLGRNLIAALASGDETKAGPLFSNDVVFEDMALRAQFHGRNSVQTFLARAVPLLPYGTGVALRHVTGSDAGGAIEWAAAPGAPFNTGVFGVRLAADGTITRLTTVYDGALYSDAEIARMAAAVLNI